MQTRKLGSSGLKVSAIGSFESIKVLNVSENNLLAFFGKIDNEKKGKITVKQVIFLFYNLNFSQKIT